ncbi:MAG: hypothetical protein WC614_13850 [bacterium]
MRERRKFRHRPALSEVEGDLKLSLMDVGGRASNVGALGDTGGYRGMEALEPKSMSYHPWRWVPASMPV